MSLAVRRQQFNVPEKWLWIAGGVAALWLLGPTLIPILTRSGARAAGTIVVEGATGIVIGVGEAVGIPETDAAKCEASIAAGDYWDASFYCPAGTFLKAASGAIYDAATGAQVGTAPPSTAPEVVSITVTDEIFKQWLAATGGVLKPGQTQQQAALEWFTAYVAAPF